MQELEHRVALARIVKETLKWAQSQTGEQYIPVADLYLEFTDELGL